MKGDILSGITTYVQKIQEASDKNFQENYSSLWESGDYPKFEVTEGRKFCKIISVCSQTSVFCFVEKSTGDIYKAETWSRPAKGARGNVSDEKLPLTLGSLYKVK